MLGHKRRAEDTLLPLRAPKQRRTTAHHPLGGNSTPSQYEGLLARWGRVSMDLVNVARDTFVTIVRFVGGAKNDALPRHTSTPPSFAAGHGAPLSPPPSPSPPPIGPPPASNQARKLPPRQPIPTFSSKPTASNQHDQLSRSAPAPHGAYQRARTEAAGESSQAPGKPEQRPFLRAYANMQTNAVASTSKNTLSGPQEGKVSALPREANTTGLMSPPSSQDSTYSMQTVVTQAYPEVAVALKQNPRRRRRSVKKQYIEREHIHAKQHKARVKEETKRTREQMEKEMWELYHIKRSSGYGSDFESFQSLMDYQARLEKLDKTGPLSPSSSLVDLRATARPEENRRHSYPDHYDLDFLQRALEKARAALQGPKPPKPFVPTLDQLRISRQAKDEEIEERLRPKRKPLPRSLPPEEDAEVDAFFRKRGVIAKCCREQVSDVDIVRLKPSQWLNDEVINFYGRMILSRAEDSKENPAPNGKTNGQKKPLNAHYFSTFFWSKLKGQGYEKARLGKWTKDFDLFSKDVILIPVNHNNAHWTAAAINFRKKRIESYDSMNMDRAQVFKLLRQYIDAEHRNKKKKPFDFTGWVDYTLPSTPQQENGFDCGVFTCQFLEALSRGEEDFPFTQANMPYLRRKMVWEIAHVKLKDNS